MTPLNLYIRNASREDAEKAVLDYGQCIRDLAVTNIFAGDLLPKNFGVTRHARVIFYDYDELCAVTDCRFRDVPQSKFDEDDMRAEAWFHVNDNDVFPETFMQFLGFDAYLKEVFLKVHGEIMTAEWWRGIQQRLRDGEVLEVLPYHRHRVRGRSVLQRSATLSLPAPPRLSAARGFGSACGARFDSWPRAASDSGGGSSAMRLRAAARQLDARCRGRAPANALADRAVRRSAVDERLSVDRRSAVAVPHRRRAAAPAPTQAVDARSGLSGYLATPVGRMVRVNQRGRRRGADVTPAAEVARHRRCGFRTTQKKNHKTRGQVTIRRDSPFPCMTYASWRIAAAPDWMLAQRLP